FSGDQDALLAAADVLVASDVVDDTAGLIADVEGHPALPGGPYCCHGGGGSGRSRSTRLRREVATTCSAIPMMNITMPIAATPAPRRRRAGRWGPGGVAGRMCRLGGAGRFGPRCLTCMKKPGPGAPKRATPAGKSSSPTQITHRALVLAAAMPRRKLSRRWTT